MGLESRYRESRKPDEFALLTEFERIQAESMLAEMILDPIDQEAAFRGRETRGQKLHHSRVVVQAGEGLAVACFPVSQQQAIGFDVRGDPLRLSPCGK